MGMKKMLKIIWILIINFVNVVPLLLLAQNSPKDYLKAHNNARAEVGVKPLNWDPQLELHARLFVEKYMADCKKAFLDASLANKYGQNSAYSAPPQSGAEAVARWVKHKHNYDYKSNSCIDGTLNCLCYTQVVWNSTNLLGCASVECQNYEATLATCLYYPPQGKIPNQRPYKIH
ncbi:hypothetical protein PIB30_018761 [Stylosanthes scabra]|uniref:SCP domain-containing protein n=1 Tax=Stylosanthes scabra TaxID=79078 RepID=A0ABU6Z6C7_9FABA|nr:hypothetical protein [Stylosanthes scabra]